MSQSVSTVALMNAMNNEGTLGKCFSQKVLASGFFIWSRTFSTTEVLLEKDWLTPEVVEGLPGHLFDVLCHFSGVHFLSKGEQTEPYGRCYLLPRDSLY